MAMAGIIPNSGISIAQKMLYLADLMKFEDLKVKFRSLATGAVLNLRRSTVGGFVSSMVSKKNEYHQIIERLNVNLNKLEIHLEQELAVDREQFRSLSDISNSINKLLNANIKILELKQEIEKLQSLLRTHETTIRLSIRFYRIESRQEENLLKKIIEDLARINSTEFEKLSATLKRDASYLLNTLLDIVNVDTELKDAEQIEDRLCTTIISGLDKIENRKHLRDLIAGNDKLIQLLRKVSELFDFLHGSIRQLREDLKPK